MENKLVSEILTRENLYNYLEKIGYTIKFGNPHREIYDHNNKPTNIYVAGDTLFVENEKGIRVIFIFNKAKIRQTNVQTITISNEGCFMNLYNFDKK